MMMEAEGRKEGDERGGERRKYATQACTTGEKNKEKRPHKDKHTHPLGRGARENHK